MNTLVNDNPAWTTAASTTGYVNMAIAAVASTAIRPTGTSFSEGLLQDLPTVVVDMVLDDSCVDGPSNSRIDDASGDMYRIQQITRTPSNAKNRGANPRGFKNTTMMTSSETASATVPGNAGGDCRGIGGGSLPFHHSLPSSHHLLPESDVRQQHPSSTAAPFDEEIKKKKNREAAARCRQRKSERVVMLEEKAKQLKQDNDELEKEAHLLHSQIVEIRTVLFEHMNRGCPVQL